MSFISLLIIAFGAAFAVVWLLHYVPITAKFGSWTFSPRLLLCKVLAPFDAFITLFLVCGSWIGFGTTLMGIGMITFNVLTGIGLSVGVVFTKKVMVPKWEKQYVSKRL
jgi:hypothetical protein